MSIFCNASLLEELGKVTEEKQLENSWEAPGMQRNLEWSAEPLRKWELGQNKGLNPSVGFQQHRKFAFSLWSKAILCALGPGRIKWEGPVLCSHRTRVHSWVADFCKYCKYSWFPPKSSWVGGFCRCCCVRVAIRSFKRDVMPRWGLHKVAPLGDGCCSPAVSRV